MAKILVTGGVGFIGTHLVDILLHKGHHITVVDNFDPFYDKKFKLKNLSRLEQLPNFTFIELDLKDTKNLAKLETPDAIIHLAGSAGVRPSIENPASYISNNIGSTHNILDFMKERNVKKLIFASSSSIYGNNVKIPFSENHDVSEPISPYAFTKRSCELMNYTYHQLYKFDILNLRFFTVYGPGQRPDLAIHKFVKRVINGESIDMYGDGSSSRDYTFVEDTVAGINQALNYLLSNQGVYEIVNIGNNQPVKLSYLIECIENATGREAKIKQLPMQSGDVNITYADISKAQQLFNYKPKISLTEGLNSFVKWYKNNND